MINTNNGNYDACCGLDYNPILFYDTFATRDINGHQLQSDVFPYFSDTDSKMKIELLEPVPV